QAVDSGAIIITGESAKTRNARPAVMGALRSRWAILTSGGFRGDHHHRRKRENPQCPPGGDGRSSQSLG
ncbi:hypothetical protein CKJ89_39575, partial [Klebsiella pneumoniae]